MGNPPTTIELKAVQMLREAGYLWDDSLFAFRRTRRIGAETAEQYLNSEPKIVPLEELDDHGLVLRAQTNGLYATPENRRMGLQWLESRLREDSIS
jgi:hypothetical protein